MKAIVTHVSNVQTDSEGNFQFDEEGNLLLIDENDMGIMADLHVSQVQKLENGMLLSGTSTLAEVYWQIHRSPAPALVAPNDLAWVSLPAIDGDEDEETDETFDESSNFANFDSDIDASEDELDH